MKPPRADYMLCRYWQRRARGACVRCGARTGHTGIHCLPCRDRLTRYYRARRPLVTAAQKSASARAAALRRWYGDHPEVRREVFDFEGGVRSRSREDVV